MDYLKRLLSYARRAADDYGMIRDGDRVAVGLSGGKDSLSLLCVLAALRRFYPAAFDLVAVRVRLGFEGEPGDEGIQALCEELGVPFRSVPTDIARIVFGMHGEENPCSLCANLRRGALNAEAKAQGCSSVALGHHLNDAVETFLLNLFHEGRIGCFRPVTDLSRTGLRVIRPMIYAPAKEICAFASARGLPVSESVCPADRNSERAAVRRWIAEAEARDRGFAKRIFGAIRRAGLDGFKPPRDPDGRVDFPANP